MSANPTKLEELRAFAEGRGAVPKSQYHPEPELAAKLLGGVEELGQAAEWDEGDLEQKQQLARGLAEVYGGLRPAVGLASVCPSRRDTPGGGKPQKCGSKQPQTVPHVAYNLGVCEECLEDHLIFQLADLAAVGGLNSSAVLLKPRVQTPCGACGKGHETASAVVHHCSCCGLAVHDECLATQMEGELQKDTPVNMICSSCVTERQTEVNLLVYVKDKVVRPDGAQWCVVEVTKDFYQKGTSVHLWTAHAKKATRSWAAVTRWDPNQPVMSPAAAAKKGRSRADLLKAEAEKPALEQKPKLNLPKYFVKDVKLERHDPTAMRQPKDESDEEPDDGSYQSASESELGDEELSPKTSKQADGLAKGVAGMQLKGARYSMAHLLRAFDEVDSEVTRVSPRGTVDGYTSGAEGCPGSITGVRRVDYIGMGAKTKEEKRTTLRLAGCERLDCQKSFRFWPEETGGGKTELMLGDVAVSTTSTKKRVPGQALLLQYMRALRTEWQGYVDSDEFVFSNKHRHGEFYQLMGTVIVGRLRYLEALVVYLTVDLGKPWELSWRYLSKAADEYCYNMPPDDRDVHDRRILKAMAKKNGEAAFRCLVRDSIREHWLTEAQVVMECTKATVKKPAEAAPSGSGKAAEQPKAAKASKAHPNERCSLCGKQGHCYRRQAFECTEPITALCPRILTDGAACGLAHAYTGPRSSPCRGGLAAAPGGVPRA